MDSKRRALGWAVIVGIVAVTGGVGWVLVQGGPNAPIGFASEVPYYRGNDVQPDTRQVRVFATDKHGEPLVGAQLTATDLRQRVGDEQHFPIAGANGDWVVYNLDSRDLFLRASCPGYASGGGSDQATVTDLGSAPDTYRFTLYRGAKASGCVVDTDTGEPIEGARVNLPGWGAVTDADGRYTADRVSASAEDPGTVHVEGDEHVLALVEGIHFEDEKTHEIPDIRLQRGGFIVGKIARPPKADEDVYFRSSAGIERLNGNSEPYLTDVRSVPPDGAFRLGPIRPGSHVLCIKAGNSPGKKSTAELIQNPRGWDRAWEARETGIQVRAGEETDIGTIELELVSEERVHDGWAW